VAAVAPRRSAFRQMRTTQILGELSIPGTRWIASLGANQRLALLDIAA
jgi:hypothetical protein